MDAEGQDHIDARRRRVRAWLTLIAGAVALLIAIAVPALHFVSTFRYATSDLSLKAKFASERLSTYVYAHPELWEISEHRLESLLSDLQASYLESQILVSNKNGKLIVQSHMPVRAPTFSATAAISDGFATVGHVEIVSTLLPILLQTFVVALFSLGLAMAMFAVLRIFPLRILDSALGSLLDTQAQLGTKVEELAEARDEAAAANRTKSEFLANMSHELRTPLNAILGFSELMNNATLGPLGNAKYEEYAKDINDSGRHLLGLIQDILDLSKIEAGRLELDEEDIDVARTIRSCLVLVKERARNGGVTLKTDIPEGLPALHADKRKLKQILVNLLSNAVKFTPAGGEVTVKTWWRPDSGYVFQVIDTGIGIALANISTAVSPFGQVDSALSRKYEGTGLGLPLTKSLVEMHGGSLDLQSEEGAGTTVTVRFPKERIVHPPEAARTGSPAA